MTHPVRSSARPALVSALHNPGVIYEHLPDPGKYDIGHVWAGYQAGPFTAYIVYDGKAWLARVKHGQSAIAQQEHATYTNALAWLQETLAHFDAPKSFAKPLH